MVSSRSRGIANTFLLAQLLLTSVCFWMLFVVWDLFYYRGGIPLSTVLFYNEFLLLGLLVTSDRPRGRPMLTRPDGGAAHGPAWRQTFGVMMTLFFAALAVQDSAFPRGFLFSFPPVLYVSCLCMHLWLSPWLSRAIYQSKECNRVLLAGNLSRLPRIQHWLSNKRHLGLNPIGYLSDSESGDSTCEIPWLGELSDMKQVLEDFQVDQVILLELMQRKEEVQHIVTLCEGRGVRLLVMSDLEDHFRHSVTFFEDDGLHLISLREEPLEDPVNQFMKRALDIAVSAPIVLFVLPWVTVVVWVLQRLQSKGPVFHMQIRAGVQNRPFLIIKYRTMHVNHGCEEVQAHQGDQRIFPAGRWLRRLSIDELPQFLNVLKGEMSVVGPRPHLTAHNDAFCRVMSNYNVRGMVKPGISGLAQIRGYRGETRTDLDIIRRVSADIDYLENWSFFLDCWIIAKTVKQVVLPPKSAY